MRTTELINGANSVLSGSNCQLMTIAAHWLFGLHSWKFISQWCGGGQRVVCIRCLHHFRPQVNLLLSRLGWQLMLCEISYRPRKHIRNLANSPINKNTELLSATVCCSNISVLIFIMLKYISTPWNETHGHPLNLKMDMDIGVSQCLSIANYTNKFWWALNLYQVISLMLSLSFVLVSQMMYMSEMNIFIQT